MIYIVIMSPSTVCVLLCTHLLLCLYNNFSRNLICIINIYNPIASLLGGQGLCDKRHETKILRIQTNVVTQFVQSPSVRETNSEMSDSQKGPEPDRHRATAFCNAFAGHAFVSKILDNHL